jgi:hypothetical protein
LMALVSVVAADTSSHLQIYKPRSQGLIDWLILLFDIHSSLLQHHGILKEQRERSPKQ